MGYEDEGERVTEENSQGTNQEIEKNHKRGELHHRMISQSMGGYD